MAVPVVTVISCLANQPPDNAISSLPGHHDFTLLFETDVDATHWAVERGGTGHGTGVSVASGDAVAQGAHKEVALDDTAFETAGTPPEAAEFYAYAQNADGWSAQGDAATMTLDNAIESITPTVEVAYGPLTSPLSTIPAFCSDPDRVWRARILLPADFDIHSLTCPCGALVEAKFELGAAPILQDYYATVAVKLSNSGVQDVWFAGVSLLGLPVRTPTYKVNVLG